MKRQPHLIAAFTALATLALPAAAQQLVVNPVIGTYGQDVNIEVRDLPSQVFMPGTRYTRVGSTITVDYEYLASGFGPFPPNFGSSVLSLGELPPGNYEVRARLFDINSPNAAPKVLVTNLPVVPPEKWGIYTVPQEPLAYTAADVTIRSAAYFDPASMRVSITGNVVRVDFDYRGDAPANGSTPANLSTFGSTRMPALAPGQYILEGWGRTSAAKPYERFFSKNFSVTSFAPVVEYYSPSLDHYFMTANPGEVEMIDRGGQGDWKRTGQALQAWMRASDAPSTAVPVCRFYAQGPNSHFYTGNRAECDGLKAMELQGRADAAAAGKPFLGWVYESIAFYAVLPQNGQCPGGMTRVYRAYNNRAAQMDSNHRFTTDSGQRTAMSQGWIDEGAQFCSV